jgi:hypothetical protein
MLIGIVGIRPDASREIMNILDDLARKRQLAQRAEIQPLVWGVHQAAVIQIEGVHVDVEDHPPTRSKSKGRPLGRPCYPTTESGWGDIHPNINNHPEHG